MIKITDLAKEKIIDVLIGENSKILRFGLQGGGCNGFQYYFSADTQKEEGDFEYPLDDERVMVVDSMSSMYLEEAEIDYKKDLMGETFVFNNPNTTTKCGCGSSVGF
jgi:iron-sulfur cluster assembly accessory protein